MDVTKKVDEKDHETAVLLANAGALAAAVIKKVAGNDISSAINGSSITREMISTLVTQNPIKKLSATPV